jgi:hypothetical protein
MNLTRSLPDQPYELLINLDNTEKADEGVESCAITGYE